MATAGISFSREPLDVATEGLVIGAKERIRAEIESHCADTFNRLLSEGKSAPGARSEAIARLGDPATAASGFRAKHLTDGRAQKLKTVAKICMGAGVLAPVFLLVGGGYLTSSNASFAVSLFLGSYLCGLLLSGLLLLRGFKLITPNPWRDALKNKMSRAKLFAAVLAFYMLGFLLIYRYVFSSNLGMNLFTVIHGLTTSSLLVFGIGLSRRIRRITMPAA